MQTFSYVARDPGGGELKAEVQADSESSAAKLIRDQGLTPIKITPKKGEGAVFGFKKRIKSKDKVLFSRQLATLVGAGLPITQSLRTVGEQTANPEMSKIVDQVITDVEAGKALATAFERHPNVFNNVFVSLVAAGETSGTLDEALERLADQQEKDAAIVAKVKGALVYPVIVLVVIVGVIIFMLTTVLPQVEQLYVDLEQELPFITKIMLAASDFVIGFWWLTLIIMAAMVYFAKRYVATNSGRKVWDTFKMNAPVFGRMMMKLYMARFTRTGQTLMATGVPMLEMMHITGRAVNNVNIEKSLEKAAVKVKGGTALSASIEGDKNFLSLVPQMISIGEQSGSIDAMMGKAATFYENELDDEVKAISTTIEPILMVVLAVVAGMMVGAILIPVYGLVGKTSF